MKIIAGINGFGRFSLHLLKYWLDRSEVSFYEIKYLNDDFLTIDQSINIIKKDKKVSFDNFLIKKIKNKICITKSNGHIVEIEYSNSKSKNIPWVGKPDLFLECSGKNTLKKDCLKFLKNKTSHVIISATSWDSDKTLIFGYNHKDFRKMDKIISYGSCTVNAFIPLGNLIEKKFGIIDADVNVIHNIQVHRLEKNNTLNRKFCTLEKSGPKLLKAINKNNFKVNYTVVPYTGVSIIDFRFRIKKKTTLNKLINILKSSIKNGNLRGIYKLQSLDKGPEAHNCSPFSSIFIKENLRIIKDQLYIPGYFDNENSSNRYFDLVNYVSKLYKFK